MRHEGRLATSISTRLTSKEEKSTKSRPVGYDSRMLASYAATDDVRPQLFEQCEKERALERKSRRGEKKGSKQGKKRTVVFMGRDAAALPPKLISNVTTPASDQV
jgi:hypothetical protein